MEAGSDEDSGSLVTGRAGYVGNACLRHGVAEGHEAIAYDNLLEGHHLLAIEATTTTASKVFNYWHQSHPDGSSSTPRSHQTSTESRFDVCYICVDWLNPTAAGASEFHRDLSAMTKPRHEDRLEKWARAGKTGAEPVAAATVVLLRDTERGLETLMLRRNSKIAFGGMWVFPGGRVDESDRAGLAPDDELGAARQAAVREAHEESGLAIAHDGLSPLSHWTPPPITPRRFLTWFFVAQAPLAQVVIDNGEIKDHAWMSVREALLGRDRGEIELAPPTFVTLHGLASHKSVEEAMEATRSREPEFFETHIAMSDEGPVAIWHGDAGYAESDASRPGARHRLSMRKAQWMYERSD